MTYESLRWKIRNKLTERLISIHPRYGKIYGGVFTGGYRKALNDVLRWVDDEEETDADDARFDAASGKGEE